MIQNPDMQTDIPVGEYEPQWQTFTEKGPRYCIAVIRPLRKRTRRAQRNRLVRIYVDTQFSCQYKATVEGAAPTVRFVGNQVIIGNTFSPSAGEKLFFAMPQLEWEHPK